jgi:hypothetical protein
VSNAVDNDCTAGTFSETGVTVRLGATDAAAAVVGAVSGTEMAAARRLALTPAVGRGFAADGDRAAPAAAVAARVWWRPEGDGSCADGESDLVAREPVPSSASATPGAAANAIPMPAAAAPS